MKNLPFSPHGEEIFFSHVGIWGSAIQVPLVEEGFEAHCVGHS